MKKLRTLLLPLSGLYGLIIRLRNLFYDKGWLKTHKVGVPVISVGNISTGGTGKTPLAAFLLEYFTRKGKSPAYLSRGYGRKTKGFLLVDPAQGGPEEFGDEALLIANRFPDCRVAVCEDRVLGARQLIKNNKVDLIILDDAFQHRRIHRDLNLLAVDAGSLPQQDFMLPAGNLREPLSPALRRVDAVILSKLSPEQSPEKLLPLFHPRPTAFHRYAPEALVPFDPQGSTLPSEMKGLRLIAFSGLGNNAFFQRSLVKAGAKVLAFFPFPDHHSYTASDLGKILAKFEAEKKNSGNLSPPLILSTEKDFHRLLPLWKSSKLEAYPFYYLRQGLEWVAGWEEIETLIKTKIASFENNRTH